MRSKDIMTTGNFPWTVFLSATFYVLAIYVSVCCSIRKLQFGKMNAWELHLALIQTWFYTWKCRQIYQVRANEYHYQNNKNDVQQLINCIFHFYTNTALPVKMLVVSGRDQWEWFLNFGPDMWAFPMCVDLWVAVATYGIPFVCLLDSLPGA